MYDTEFCKAAEDKGEKIHCFDVCSLYPFINKYVYPVGQPRIYIGDEACR